jgi:hypothetical protein
MLNGKYVCIFATKTNTICIFRDIFATQKHTGTKTKNSHTYMDGNDI